ncbi:MAG TPA: hypothetical protein VHW23_12715 [Kofleriaceae bacterium]|nr:hypothetical protein [Kofleriaceae bacterium]
MIAIRRTVTVAPARKSSLEFALDPPVRPTHADRAERPMGETRENRAEPLA